MAMIGGQLAHPTPLQNNYCNGLVQPSLIMNHHVDCQEDIHPILATNITGQTGNHFFAIMKKNIYNCIQKHFKSH
ncbi:CLUMA_CG014065, isoform A [Clunio marinus]|uniref:CLUMA_CG014065, isoform A n=1 Tax=Clunio marinus TaxID=568069 RepID=A0A1J1INZ8_9DIPT|nr:CLUMA_CG014065, isoform A [Clunio marinus]